MLGSGGLLGSGLHAVGRQRWLIVPMSLAIGLRRLLGLIPGLLVIVQVIAASQASGQEFGPESLLAGLAVLLKPQTWLLAVQGSILSVLGAWLLTTLIGAGSLRLLGEQVGRKEPASEELFSEGIIDAGVRALLTGALAELLRWFVLLCGLGMLGAGFFYFSEKPGALAALLMTVATAVIVLLPTLVAALDVGLARTVMLAEDPIAAVGNGLILALRRAGALLGAWYLLVFIDLVLLVAVGSISGTISAFPAEEGFWILLLGPRAFVWIVGIVLAAAVHLLRLGVYATLVAEDAGTLPAPAPQRPPPPSDQVYEAVLVEGPSGHKSPAES